MTLTEEHPDQPQMVGIPDTLRHLAVPIDSLQPYHKNARRRASEIVNDSLRRHGQYRPIVVNRGTLTGRDNEILAGNGTWAEAKSLEWPFIAVTFVDVSEDTAARIVLVDNKANDEAGYDERLLAELLGSLPDLDGTGFDPDELAQMLDQIAEESLTGTEDFDGDEDADVDAGTLLALADVSMGEPHHQPAHGSRWRLGRHLLVVAKISSEHHLWSGDLDGRVFCPYPDPYLTASVLAEESALLLVQPNRYLAGHLLDKHEAVFPGTVETG